MRGATFITMHPLMDQHMELLDAQLDEVSRTFNHIGWSSLFNFYVNLPITLRLPMPKELQRQHGRPHPSFISRYRYLIDLYQKGIDVTG